MSKDKIGGWKYYEKGKLKAESKGIDIERKLNKELWDCPQCGRHTMEQVQFATYSASPEGQPGLLCFHCHYMLSGEELDSYMIDEDGWRDV